MAQQEMTPQQAQKAVQDLLKQPGNTTCADCHCPSPTWASINLGVFICLDCSAHHRAMGTHISKVKSTTLDKWTLAMVEGMRRAGNTKANAYWEKGLPPNIPRPTTPDARGLFIRQKYEQGKFRNELPQQPSTSSSQQQHQSHALASQTASLQPVSSASIQPASVDVTHQRRRRAPPSQLNGESTQQHHHEAQPAKQPDASRQIASVDISRNPLKEEDLLSMDGFSNAGSLPIMNGHSNGSTQGSSSFSFMASASDSHTIQSTAADNLTQIEKDLESVAAKLNSLTLALQQTSGSSTSKVDIRGILAQGAPFVQINEQVLQRIMENPVSIRHAAEALRRAADALEAGGTRFQSQKIKDELALECGRLDALQMQRIDSLTGLEGQSLIRKKNANARVTTLLQEAQMLHAKVLIQLSSGGETAPQSHPMNLFESMNIAHRPEQLAPAPPTSSFNFLVSGGPSSTSATSSFSFVGQTNEKQPGQLNTAIPSFLT